MIGISHFYHDVTDSDLYYDKFILSVRNVSKTQVNNWKPF